MNRPVVAYIGWLLLIAALGFYGYGIYEAIRLSWGSGEIKEDAFPKELSTIISSIQSLLLTNLGILLGISIAKPDSAVAKQLLLGKQTTLSINLIPNPLELREKIQLFAMIVYVISLIICLVTWIKEGFSSNLIEIVPVVSESGKMFIGVVLAYLTAVLGTQGQNK